MSNIEKLKNRLKAEKQKRRMSNIEKLKNRQKAEG